MRARLLAASLAGLAVAFLAGAWWAGLLHAPAPDRAGGERWTQGFIAQVTAPSVLGARGAAAGTALPGLSAQDAGSCPAFLTQEHPFAAIVTGQYLSLDTHSPDCSDRQPISLNTRLRVSDGISPAVFERQLRALYGADALSAGDAATLVWQPLPHLTVRLTNPAKAAGQQFWLEIERIPDTATAIPTAAEAERWTDGFVAQLTDPALANGHGTAVAAVLGRLTPAADQGRCPAWYEAPDYGPSPYVSSAALFLSDAEPLAATCEGRPFASYRAALWRYPGMDLDGLAARFTRRFGVPRLGENTFGPTRTWMAPYARFEIGMDRRPEALPTVEVTVSKP